MFNLEMGFFICDTPGFLRIMYLVKLAMQFLRFAVPIILIVMIALDVTKNVIDPNQKEGMKKIINRLVAAAIVFLIPTLVNVIVSLIGYIEEVDENGLNYSETRCYTNANTKCIKRIEDYLNCEGKDGEEARNCQRYRKCNDYKVSNTDRNGGCYVTTVEDNKLCKSINSDSKYTSYKK